MSKTTTTPAPTTRRYGGANGYGHKGDLTKQRTCEDRKVVPIHIFFAKKKINAKTATPSSFSLRAKGCPILDQGPTGSCTGHGYAGAIYTTLNYAGTPIKVPSPANLYKLARCIDRGDPTQPLTDSGADPDSVARGILEYGVDAMVSPTSDGRFDDCELSTLNVEPQLDQLEADSLFTLEGAYGLDPTSPTFVQDMRTAISNGYAVNFAQFVDSAFEALNSTTALTPIGAPNTNDQSGGGHDLYCDGYHEVTDASGNVMTVFDCVNSWSAGWGAGGYFQCGPADYIPPSTDSNVGWSNVMVLKVTPISGGAPVPVTA